MNISSYLNQKVPLICFKQRWVWVKHNKQKVNIEKVEILIVSIIKIVYGSYLRSIIINLCQLVYVQTVISSFLVDNKKIWFNDRFLLDSTTKLRGLQTLNRATTPLKRTIPFYARKEPYHSQNESYRSQSEPYLSQKEPYRAKSVPW